MTITMLNAGRTFLLGFRNNEIIKQVILINFHEFLNISEFINFI